jgi:hypothetical protein
MNIEEYRAMVAQQDSQVEQPTEPVVEPVAVEPEPTPEPVSTEPEKPQVFEIDGQEVTLEELQKGYLRQSDYTRKTQAVSRERQQIEQDLAIVEQLRSNPELAQQLSEFIPQLDSEKRRTAELEGKLFDLMLERDIDRLSSKYPDFDAREVLTVAQEKNLTNIEDAYLLLKSTQPQATTPQETKTEEPALDIQALTAQIKADLLKELAEQNTGSIIGSGGADVPPRVQAEPQLTDMEKRVAQGMGLNDADYVKWRDAGRKKR